MLYRKIYHDLMNWKNSKSKKPLIVFGARQVGKTFIIEQFAKKEFNAYLHINFIETPRLINLFDDDLSADSIYKQLSALYSSFVFSKDTIIFFDEIQNCPKALAALKFLAIDGRVNIIASGSLLGINYKEKISYPVGYVESLTMYSLDFEEFLYANGYKEDFILQLYDYYNKLEKIPEVIHKALMKLFKEFIVVGGMPEVVNKFIDTKLFNDVDRLQKEIISNYRLDIGKHTSSVDSAKIKQCFDSIPSQLSKDYKKFQYSLVKKGAKSIHYESALAWLNDANIVSFCNNVNLLEKPLVGNMIKDQFKVYINDTGLLVAMLDEGSRSSILSGELEIYKGAIYENIIAETLIKNNKKLYYYRKPSGLELDFITNTDGELTIIKVKSSNNTKSKSLNTILNIKPYKAIKLSTRNISKHEKFIELPLYLAHCIK